MSAAAHRSAAGVGAGHRDAGRRDGRAQPAAGARPASCDGAALRRGGRAPTFDSYARYWVEAFRLPGTTPEPSSTRHVACDGFEHVDDAIARAATGVILALPHLGGWEWAASGWRRSRAAPSPSVVEALEPPELFEWFVDFRRASA